MSEINQEAEMQKTTEVVQSVIGSMNADLPEVPVLRGRKKILTGYLNSNQIRDGMGGYILLNKDNMHKALTQAMKIHRNNAGEIKYLIEYSKGQQEILKRVKGVREDIDNKIVINYAHTFTRDIIGYTFGKPMQYVTKNGEDNIKEEIKLISDYAELADESTSDQIKATIASICGISHRAVFMNKNYEDDDESPFAYMNLDSENTFVAYSSQIGEPEVFGCTYITNIDENDNKTTIYTVYTTKEIYQYKTPGLSNIIMKEHLVQGYPKPNPLGMVLIVENENNQFRMGHWEIAIALMDAINKLTSDSVNDVEQFVNAILVAINVEFTKETMQSIREDKYAEISSPKGLNADIKYLRDQLDGTAVEQLRQYLEDCLRVVVGIPDRKTRGGGGGDTGDAVKLRDGWADMEVVARTTETFNKKSKRKETKIILKIMKALKLIEKTSMINIDMKYPRNKTDNLNSKATAMATLNGMEIMAPDDILEIGDITTDIAEVVKRGEEYWEKKKQKNIEDNRKQLQIEKELVGDGENTQQGGNRNANTESRTTGTNTSTKSTKSTNGESNNSNK